MNARLIAVVCSVALAAACQKETSSNPVKKDEAPRAAVALPAPAASAEAPTPLPSQPKDSLPRPHDPSDAVDHLDRSRELAKAGNPSGPLFDARLGICCNP